MFEGRPKVFAKRHSVKIEFFEKFRKIHRKTLSLVRWSLFFNKVSVFRPETLFKIETQIQVSSCEFCRNF